MKTFCSAIAAALALLTGCAGAAPEVERASAPTAAPALSDATAAQADAVTPALYVAADEDTTIYLFGTVHMLDEARASEWFDGDVKAAFDASDELYVEVVDLGPQEMQAAMARGIDTEGPMLSETLSPDGYAALTAELGRFGIDPAAFEPMDPWFASINLAGLYFMKLGLSPEQGVERALLAAAEARGLPTKGLETIDYQFGLFDSMPEDEQVEMLEDSLDELAHAETEITRMMDAWAAGDEAALAALMNEDMDDPAIKKRLLTDRNANWAKQLKARLDQPGTVFVAVGAGHLGGEGSVQDQLRGLGIETRRVGS